MGSLRTLLFGWQVAGPQGTFAAMTAIAVTLLTVWLMLKTKVHPLALVALGAGAGLLGLV